MAIQARNHEVTVAMIKRIYSFYTQCSDDGMLPDEAVKTCQEKFNISRMYADQARRVGSSLTEENQKLCDLLDSKKISVDTCLTIIQCAEANNLALNIFVSEILQDFSDSRISKGQFVKWRDQKNLKKARQREKSSIKVHLDEQANAVYVRLDESEIIESKEVHPGVVLDFDNQNRVVGIEILKMKERS